MRGLFRARAIVNHLKNKNSNNLSSIDRSMSTKPPEDDVVVQEIDNKRVFILNRAKALNALNLSMIRKMYPKLKNYESDSNVKLVILKGAGGKAFCAGGDVISITESAKTDGKLGRDFFREEYNLDYLLGTYKKPVVALIDGVTMGGGLGISVHTPVRVATERTLCAMPETAIGLFPDVGGSHFLPRLRGKLGLYLALTSTRLRGWDCLEAQIATHFVHSQFLEELEKALLALKPEQINKTFINEVVMTFQKKSIEKEGQPKFSLLPHLEKINTLFNESSVEKIWSNLSKDGSSWALQQLEIMKKMSPLSMKVTLRQLEKGAKLTLEQCLQMEYRLGVRFLKENDFIEGVRALLVHKDNKPKWLPTTLEGVTDSKVESLFSPLVGEEELTMWPR